VNVDPPDPRSDGELAVWTRPSLGRERTGHRLLAVRALVVALEVDEQNARRDEPGGYGDQAWGKVPLQVMIARWIVNHRSAVAV
jgi:hypothetical protein